MKYNKWDWISQDYAFGCAAVTVASVDDDVIFGWSVKKEHAYIIIMFYTYNFGISSFIDLTAIRLIHWINNLFATLQFVHSQRCSVEIENESLKLLFIDIFFFSFFIIHFAWRVF